MCINRKQCLLECPTTHWQAPSFVELFASEAEPRRERTMAWRSTKQWQKTRDLEPKLQWLGAVRQEATAKHLPACSHRSAGLKLRDSVHASVQSWRSLDARTTRRWREENSRERLWLTGVSRHYNASKKSPLWLLMSPISLFLTVAPRNHNTLCQSVSPTLSSFLETVKSSMKYDFKIHVIFISVGKFHTSFSYL